MKKEELESAILGLWLKSQIPLTRAHLQYHTGVSRKKLEEWLDELVVEGVLGVDITDDGEMLYEVSGASRPANGAQSFAELERLTTLEVQVSGSKPRSGRSEPAFESLQAELLAGQAKGLVKRASKSLATKEGDKSILTSGALSFLFGPLGWFYAGSYKEASIGSIAALLVLKLLPSFFLFPVLMLGLPLSGIAGMMYAWQHNRRGERIQLLGSGDDSDDD